jgi:hypothetical protein
LCNTPGRGDFFPKRSEAEEASLPAYEKTVSASLSDITTRFFDYLRPINLGRISREVLGLMKAPRFALSEWQRNLSPLLQLLPALVPVCRDFNRLREELLAGVRAAKEAGELEEIDPAALKERLKRSLLEQTEMLCSVVMLLQDIDAIYRGKETLDVIHLLPEPILKLLDLDEFDKIFALPPSPETLPEQPEDVDEATDEPEETAVVAVAAAAAAVVDTRVLASVRPVVRSASASGPAAAASSERQIPDKREFTQVKRRRVILRVLDRLGFKSEGTGRHEKWRHGETRGTVAVPLSLEAHGTRQSIYDQVVAALENKEDS